LSLLPGRKVAVTPLPVFDVYSGDQPAQNEARRLLGLPAEAPVLLFFGFVRPYKGLGLLLQALGLLRQQGLQPFLAIAGEFWHDKASYLDQIEQLGLGEQVRIEDRYIPNEELGLWLAAADVAVAPYIEGTTQSAVASLLLGSGLPLILSEQVAQGVRQSDLQNLVVVPTGDVPALAGAIRAFIVGLGEAKPFRQRPTDDWDEFISTLDSFAT
jgi:glycosyltransferase involved in cell wall biosynthesis